MVQQMNNMEMRRGNCLSCVNSFSLPAGEPYDDGSVCEHDRLVCSVAHSIVSEDHVCTQYHD